MEVKPKKQCREQTLNAVSTCQVGRRFPDRREGVKRRDGVIEILRTDFNFSVKYQNKEVSGATWPNPLKDIFPIVLLFR